MRCRCECKCECTAFPGTDWCGRCLLGNHEPHADDVAHAVASIARVRET